MMDDVDKAFYNLVVKERDLARTEGARLERELCDAKIMLADVRAMLAEQTQYAIALQRLIYGLKEGSLDHCKLKDAPHHTEMAELVLSRLRRRGRALEHYAMMDGVDDTIAVAALDDE